MIDWDLEAPGLHRYYHPFLADPEMTATPGIIDFFLEFVAAARTQPESDDTADTAASGNAPWYVPYADLLHYVVPVQWNFGSGHLHMVSAGQQGGGYSARVAGMDWGSFYSELGGGVFVQSMKQQLRERYDYVLIDSRTGLSDTSGICAVQMPDDLVCCFTLNLQSILGAAAVAESAFEQRRKPDTGEPGLRVWPVATRVELSERDRLERAHSAVHRSFSRFIAHLPRAERSRYFASVEVLYQPYFAYEEILAVIADRRHQTGSLLSSFEQIARWLTGDQHMQLAELPEDERLAAKAKFLRSKSGTRVYVLMNMTEESAEDSMKLSRLVPAWTWKAGLGVGNFLGIDNVKWIKELRRLLVSLNHHFGHGNVLMRRDIAPLISRVLNVPVTASTVADAQALLTVNLHEHDMPMDPPWLQGELEWARDNELPLIQVQLPGYDLPRRRIPNLRYQGIVSLTPDNYDADSVDLCQAIEDAVANPRRGASRDTDDPNKGHWGGRSEHDGVRLSAEVSAVPNSKDWFRIALEVAATGEAPLEGEVVFYVHPTFEPSTLTVPVRDGRARVELQAWGAFTVGASAHQGKTFLELDLAADPSSPEVFRLR